MAAPFYGQDLWLFRYIMVVTTLAFCNRALPMPFLPIVLEHRFGQSDAIIGCTIAVYPIASLLATPLASRVARSADHIVKLHSIAIVAMGITTLLFASCNFLVGVLGADVAMVFVLGYRAAQGVANALYLASNTSLVVRYFPENTPFVIGMAEVAVGVGAQLGRLVGGFLYDQGGFACPFCCISVLQIVAAVFGFAFARQSEESAMSPVASGGPRSVPLSALATPRMGAACLSTLLNYLLTGIYDGTLPLHLESSLPEVTVTLIGAIYALRSISYMLVCWLCARVMRYHLLSFEHLIAVGAGCGAVGLITIGPQAIILESISSFGVTVGTGGPVDWLIMLSALALSSAGCALLLVPSLPLMQSEAKPLGNLAVEQTGSLFMIMMSVGEATGPVLGGWAVGQVGFVAATGLFAWIYLATIGVALGVYDPQAAAARAEALPTRKLLASPELGRRNPRWKHASLG